MKRRLVSIISVLCMIVPLFSSIAAALTDYELQELFQQEINTKNFVTIDEFTFFNKPLIEIGSDIDTVKEIMRQNSLNINEVDNGVNGIMVHGINLGLGINVLVDQMPRGAKVIKGDGSGEYDIFDDLVYKYYFTGNLHKTNIGIRDICIGDSLGVFLDKLGFSNASTLADIIQTVTDVEYESKQAAKDLLRGISCNSGHMIFSLEVSGGSPLDADAKFRPDLAHTPLTLYSLDHRLSCRFYFQNGVLHDCEITFLTPATQADTSQSDGLVPPIELPTEKLSSITDIVSVSEVVSSLTSIMTSVQKTTPDCIDLATLYAETAVSKAAIKSVTGDSILVDATTVSDLELTAVEASEAAEMALTDGGVTTARYLSKTIIFTTDEQDISIQIDPDILTTKVDKVRVETPTYAVTFKLSDLESDLTQSLTFTAQNLGTGYAAGSSSGKTTVKVSLPNGRTTNSITVSLPSDSGDTTYQAVVSTDGQATASKYNPATTTMDGKINTSGTYTVKSNEKDFTDISGKSAEMQTAIRYLASKGIINGTTATTFSPDGSINRAEIATLLVKALGKLDSTATASFSDVTKSNWFYTAAASSQRHKLINGYEDNTFQGTTNISKVQIVAVSSRVLKAEMGYKEPASPATYLSKYSDTIDSWAQSEVALATKENLVVYRTDGTFSGDKNMTRGDAAIIIYRLFQRIW